MKTEMSRHVWEMVSQGYFPKIADEWFLNPMTTMDEGEQCIAITPPQARINIRVDSYSVESALVRFQMILGRVEDPSSDLLKALVSASPSHLSLGAFTWEPDNKLIQFDYAVLGDTLDEEEFEAGFKEMLACTFIKEQLLEPFSHEVDWLP